MAKKKTSKKHYKTFYFILGLIINFIGLLALFNWGFLGSMIANSFRLLVGEAYSLLLVIIIFYAFYLIFKGQTPPVSWQNFLGGLIVLASICLALHLKAFYPLTEGPASIFERTFDRFKTDFLASQIAENIGGGLVGAILFQISPYLFGAWGSYILASLSFFLGLLLYLNIPFYTLVKFLKEIWHQISQRVQALPDFFSQVKAVYNDNNPKVDPVRSEEDSNYPSNHKSKAYDFKGYDQPNQAAFDEVSDRSFYEDQDFEEKPQGFFGKLGQYFLFGDLDEEEPDSSIMDSSYQPAYEGKKLTELEEFKTTKSSQIAQPKHRTVTLDMDYFDQLQDDRPKISPKNREDLEAGPSYEDSKDFKPDQPRLLESWRDDEDPNYEEGLPPAQEPEAESTADEDRRGQKEIAKAKDQASHWQESAERKQSLTDDELDRSLESLSSAQASKKIKVKKNQAYQLPSKKLLTKGPKVDQSEEYDYINRNISKLEQTFDSFGVDARVVKANLGPAVTKYEIEPAVGVKVSKIVSLSDDISLALAARDIRIEAPIPGKSLIGIEVPNKQISPVYFYELAEAAIQSPAILEVPLGRDVSGQICTADLSKMPHLLMAGATGSGKSVGMNVIITSLLMKARPHEVKLLMIDPKMVELSVYNDIPHLLAPVVTNPRKAAQALNKVVQEMERRYKLFAAAGVRNQEAYNKQVEESNQTEGTAYEKLPKIVVFVDELADLMLVASNEVETAITRLAQMARAAGIHMIIATQRPSVDVITGIIKANIPSRLAFAVSSGTDSRTILDSNGAEKLLGRGDMLFLPMGMNKPIRVQGAYISDGEVEVVADFVRQQAEPDYDENMLISEESVSAEEISEDEYFQDALEMIKDQETISISQLQRRFRIGYNRAARLVDDLEALGYVSPADGSKPRQVLIGESEVDEH